MTMKNLIRNLGLTAMLALSASQAQALLLTPADCIEGVNCWTVYGDSSQPTSSSVESLVGTSSTLTELYKNEVGGDPFGVGTYAGSYQTTYFNSELDPQEALIEYLGGIAISCGECYITIKDGNNSPSLYAFDISGWDGMEDISLQDFWPRQGAISNIAIWGTTNVPLPATVSLLAIGLVGMGLARKRKA